jgi:ribulose 1,5-bisphosphate synthetase/thiazole synthase
MVDDATIADVIVIGGGSAGLAAAVMSAREGAKTILLEKMGYMGGMGSSALVHSFCGLYFSSESDAPARFANQGFPREMAERMQKKSRLPAEPMRMGKVWVLPQNPLDFVSIADDLVREETNLTVSILSTALEVIHLPAENHWRVTWLCQGRKKTCLTKSVVDASGHADVAAMLGALQQDVPSRLQRPAYISVIHAGPVLDDAMRMQTAGLIVQGVRAGALPQMALGMTFRKYDNHSDVFCTLDLGELESQVYDPENGISLAAYSAAGRTVTADVVRWLASESEPWKDARVGQWPSMLGIRESRSWRGRSTLLGDDLLAGKRQETDVALAAWPAELRETAHGPKIRYAEEHRAAGIPLPCLQTEFPGIYCAGRCVSADHLALASIRVMGTCFATGQAAGLAAAHHAQGISEAESLRRIQEIAHIPAMVL